MHLAPSDHDAAPCDTLKPCDQLHKKHVPGRVAEIDHGQGKTTTYRFNSLGYRSEEFDPNAKFRVGVVGESHTFGTGVDFEETFSQLLKRHIAAALGFHPTEVNCLNFAMEGVSADYCVRALYRQIDGMKADLVVIQLPAPFRMEYVSDRGFQIFNVRSVDPEKLETTAPPLLGYCELYNPVLGRFMYLKNLLLIQSLLKARDIDHIIGVLQYPNIGLREEDARDFSDHIDWDTVFEHGYLNDRQDFAADGRHAGPLCHSALAEALLARFAEIHEQRDGSNLRRRLAEYAALLKQQNVE